MVMRTPPGPITYTSFLIVVSFLTVFLLSIIVPPNIISLISLLLSILLIIVSVNFANSISKISLVSSYHSRIRLQVKMAYERDPIVPITKENGEKFGVETSKDMNYHNPL